jgi:Ca2+-binding EF-hand superfamily protein
MFDTSKSGFIDTLKISTILNTMGQLFDDSELNELIEEVDPDGKLLFTFIEELLIAIIIYFCSHR